MLYKYYEVLNGIQFNFNVFNQLLTEEIKEEDEMASNLKDTRLVAEFQLYLTNLFMSAEAMTKELDVVTQEVAAWIKKVEKKPTVDAKESINLSRVVVPQTIFTRVSSLIT